MPTISRPGEHSDAPLAIDKLADWLLNGSTAAGYETQRPEPSLAAPSSLAP